MRTGDHRSLGTLLTKHTTGKVMFAAVRGFRRSTRPLSLEGGVIIVASRTRHKRCKFRRGVHVAGGRGKRSVTGHIVNATEVVRSYLPGTSCVNFANAPVSAGSESAIRIFNGCVSICSVARTISSNTAYPMCCRSHMVGLGLSRTALETVSTRCSLLTRRNTASRRVRGDGGRVSRLRRVLNTPRAVSSLYESVLGRCRRGERCRLANGTVVITCSHPVTVDVCRGLLRLHPG